MENNYQSSNLVNEINKYDEENEDITNNQEENSHPSLYKPIKINGKIQYHILKYFQFKKIGVNLNSSNEEIEGKNNLPPLNMGEIELINDNSIDSFDYSLYESLGINFEEMKQKFLNLNKLFNCHRKISKNSYFRFPNIKEKTIYCIPQVIYTEGKIYFICDGKKIDMNIENILELINNRELFINKNQNQDILNQAYICQEQNEKNVSKSYYHKNICEKNNELNNCSEDDLNSINIIDLNNMLNYLTKLTYKYFNIIFAYKNKIIKNLKELDNENYNEEFKKIFISKLKLSYDKLEGYINYFFFFECNISLIKEVLDYQKDNLAEKYNYNITRNLIYCNEILQKRKSNNKEKRIKRHKKREQKDKKSKKDFLKIN